MGFAELKIIGYSEEKVSDRVAFWNENCTLVNFLQNRTSKYPDRLAYTFLEDGEKSIASLTYRQLDEKARAIAYGRRLSDRCWRFRDRWSAIALPAIEKERQTPYHC